MPSILILVSPNCIGSKDSAVRRQLRFFADLLGDLPNISPVVTWDFYFSKESNCVLPFIRTPYPLIRFVKYDQTVILHFIRDSLYMFTSRFKISAENSWLS